MSLLLSNKREGVDIKMANSKRNTGEDASKVKDEEVRKQRQLLMVLILDN